MSGAAAAAAAERKGGAGARGAPPLPVLFLLLVSLLAQQAAGAVQVPSVHTHVQLDIFQETFPSRKESGEFFQDFDNEEFFHVDLDHKQNVWRLPTFAQMLSFDAQFAINNLAIMKSNLEKLMKRSNHTRAQNVAPSATVYPKAPAELGDPNILICFVDKFSPPVLNITWLKNGEEVSRGVQETDFYPSMDFTFRKFSYLPFIPAEGDFYTCRVEHWGLPEPLTKIWYPRKPVPIPETTENVVCGLGLALGVLGIVVGLILFFKGRKMREGDGPCCGRGGL